MRFPKLTKRGLRRGELDPCAGSTAGTTFVEVAIAIAIFTTGMVSIMGGMMTMNTHRRMADTRAEAAALSGTAFENIRGLTINNILAYQVPVNNAGNGTINLSGVGQVRLRMFAVIPGANGAAPTLFQLGTDASGVNVAALPNPIEIRAVVSPYVVSGTTASYTSSTKIDY